MPVVEVATFQPSKVLLADPNLDLAALAILERAEGFLGYNLTPLSIHLDAERGLQYRTWTGYDVGDRKTAYVIVSEYRLTRSSNIGW